MKEFFKVLGTVTAIFFVLIVISVAFAAILGALLFAGGMP